MNIKHIALLVITLATSTIHSHENRSVHNLKAINAELKKVQENKVASFTATKKLALWDSLIDAEENCLKSDTCYQDEYYQALRGQWVQTPEGKKCRYDQMKEAGLWKIMRYIESARLNGYPKDEVSQATLAMHSALYVDDSARTPEEQAIRKKVEKELCTLLQTNVPFSEIRADLESKKQ